MFASGSLRAAPHLLSSQVLKTVYFLTDAFLCLAFTASKGQPLIRSASDMNLTTQKVCVAFEIWEEGFFSQPESCAN